MKHWPAAPATLAHQALTRALKPGLSPATIERERCTPWASATFTGSRHHWQWRLERSADDDAIRTFVASIGERDFNLPGSIVADIGAHWDVNGDADQPVLIIEALTVEAG